MVTKKTVKVLMVGTICLACICVFLIGFVDGWILVGIASVCGLTAMRCAFLLSLSDDKFNNIILKNSASEKSSFMNETDYQAFHGYNSQRKD